MIISDKSMNPGLTSEPVASVDMYPEEANQSDQHFFESQMEDDNYLASRATGNHRSSDFITGLSSSIANNARDQQSAFRNLTIASRSGKVEDLHKANRDLSHYYIDTMLDVKVISKGAQCIDKLSNLS